MLGTPGTMDGGSRQSLPININSSSEESDEEEEVDPEFE